MTEIPRELIEKRAEEIAREEGRTTRPNDVDLARAESLLQSEFDVKGNDPGPEAAASDDTKSALDPDDNPNPPPH